MGSVFTFTRFLRGRLKNSPLHPCDPSYFLYNRSNPSFSMPRISTYILASRECEQDIFAADSILDHRITSASSARFTSLGQSISRINLSTIMTTPLPLQARPVIENREAIVSSTGKDLGNVLSTEIWVMIFEHLVCGTPRRKYCQELS